MTFNVNTFDGGTASTTITVGNSGGKSGTAWDTVPSLGTGATFSYDGTHTHSGSLACAIATSSTSANQYGQWDTSVGTQTQVWFRQYLYFTANPVATIKLMRFLSSGTLCGGLALGSTGRVSVEGNGGTTLVTNTSTIPLNTYFRIEGFMIGDPSAGQFLLQFYKSADQGVPTEFHYLSGQNFTAAMTQYRFGCTLAAANVVQFWQDDIALSTTGPIGPTINSTPLVIETKQRYRNRRSARQFLSPSAIPAQYESVPGSTGHISVTPIAGVVSAQNIGVPATVTIASQGNLSVNTVGTTPGVTIASSGTVQVSPDNSSGTSAAVSVTAPSGSVASILTGTTANTSIAAIAGSIGSSILGVAPNVAIAATGTVTLSPTLNSPTNTSVSASAGSIVISLSGATSQVSVASSGTVTLGMAGTTPNVSAVAVPGGLTLSTTGQTSSVSVASSGTVSIFTTAPTTNVGVSAIVGTVVDSIQGATTGVTVTAIGGSIGDNIVGSTAGVSVTPVAGSVIITSIGETGAVSVNAVPGAVQISMPGNAVNSVVAAIAGTVLMDIVGENGVINVEAIPGGAGIESTIGVLVNKDVAYEQLLSYEGKLLELPPTNSLLSYTVIE